MKEKIETVPPGTYTADDGTLTIVLEDGTVLNTEGATS